MGESKDAALRRTLKVSFCGFGLLLTLACSTEGERERASLSLSRSLPLQVTPGVPLPPAATSQFRGTPCHRTLNILPFLSDVACAGLKDLQEAKERGDTEREETCL